ncbi:MAG TPA: exo-alpha-sialidase, partial [Verrucomicrobiae bacterium]|nr:exo-alpha-sialidase [Verrucomicrobiae bacterium]
YSSYSTLTPAQPGHVFSVTYNPAGPSATWTNLDGSSFPDFPATAVAFDSVKGDLYAANDWGVLVLSNGSSTWLVAGSGLPNVEVAGLTIVPSARKLYAATHGRSAWQLTLP